MYKKQLIKPQFSLTEMQHLTHDAMALINRLQKSFPDSGDKNIAIVIITSIKDAYERGVMDTLKLNKDENKTKV